MSDYSVWKQKTYISLDVVILDDMVNNFLKSIDDTLTAPIVTLRTTSRTDDATYYISHIMYKEAKQK